MAVNLGQYTQFDLKNPDDCMDLIDKLAWTNSQIKNELALGRRYQSIHNEILNEAAWNKANPNIPYKRR